MKEMSLDQIWNECIKMGECVVQNHSGESVITSKRQYIKDNNIGVLRSDCFFCETAGKLSNNCTDCSRCPGVLVDKSFECEHEDYNYEYKPVEFLRKIKTLNRIRKGEETEQVISS